MDISFSAFIEGIVSSPILCITVLLTLGVIFVNGWTDAPNAICHLCDNTLYGRSERYTYERRL